MNPPGANIKVVCPSFTKNASKQFVSLVETLKETDYIDDISQIEEDAGIDLPRIK